MPIDRDGVPYRTVEESLAHYRRWLRDKRPLLVKEMDAYRKSCQGSKPEEKTTDA